jgi:hypothetical protein
MSVVIGKLNVSFLEYALNLTALGLSVRLISGS